MAERAEGEPLLSPSPRWTVEDGQRVPRDGPVVTDAQLARAPRTAAAFVALPINSGDITVERRVVGNQVATKYVRRSDGTPVAGLSETFHHQGVEGGFDPPPTS